MTISTAHQDSQSEDTAKESASIESVNNSEFDRDVASLMGVPVDLSDIDDAVARIDGAIRDRKRLSFVTPNANWLVRSLDDSAVKNELLEADYSVLDGAPLVVLAKMLGIPVTSRVAGSDIFEALRRRPAFDGRAVKVFFFGGRDGAAEAAHKSLNMERGGVTSVGWLNPGFGDVETMSTDAIIGEINASKADFVLVSLGAAKGQRWIEHNKSKLTAPVVSHLGAVVDFTGGGIKRAPKLFQKTGMEWLWRIKEEPALWKRYYKDAQSLAAISITRLAPLLWARVATYSIGSSSAGGAITLERAPSDGDRVVRLKLDGVLGRDNINEVRSVFKKAVTGRQDVILDCKELRYADPLALGQLLMLQKLQNRHNRRLFIEGAPKPLQRILKANGITMETNKSAPKGEAHDLAEPIDSQVA